MIWSAQVTGRVTVASSLLPPWGRVRRAVRTQRRFELLLDASCAVAYEDLTNTFPASFRGMKDENHTAMGRDGMQGIATTHGRGPLRC